MEKVNLSEKEYKTYFELGYRYYSKSNYEEAIKYLLIASECKLYRQKSKNYLFKMYVKLGNFKLARELDLINSFKLDVMEGNFQRNIEGINAEIEKYNGSFTFRLFRMLIINYINLGEYDLAIKLTETLILSNGLNYYELIFLLVKIYIYMNNYEEAFRILNEIDYAKMVSDDNRNTIRFKRLYVIVARKLGYNIGDIEAYLNNYFLSDVLLQKAFIPSSNNKVPIKVYFSRVESDKISYIEEEMKRTNPIIGFRGYPLDSYIIKFSEPIGELNGEATSYLNVFSEINTQNIVRINPVVVSTEFDMEGNIHSEELLLKRKRGIK